MITINLWSTLGVLLVTTAGLGTLMVPWLQRMKYGQTIREEGPAGHAHKAGTPTMGGFIFILPVVLFSVMLGLSGAWLALAGLVGFGGLGYLDDILKIRRRHNEGLTARQKMAGQLALAGLLSLLAWRFSPAGTVISLFSHRFLIDLGPGKILISVLVLISVTNATNLTDGLDGLLTGAAIPVFGFLGLAAARFGYGDNEIFAYAMLVALVGFFLHNRYPARVFMGDTGSLAIGGAMGGLALGMGLELSLIFLGGLFLVETVSVILQVLYFRRTGGRRLFLMSPLHHHFELKDWPEQKIVRVFSLVSWGFCLVGFVFLII